VVHLRPEPGLGPAHLQYPEATHELMLAALDPDQHPEAQRPDTWRPLRPLNLVYQFHGLSDARAATLAAFAPLGWWTVPSGQSRAMYRALAKHGPRS